MLRISVQPFSSFLCASVLQLPFWSLLRPSVMPPAAVICLLINHLPSSAFSPFSTGFCRFCNFHTSRSPIFHTSLSPFFFINSCAFSYCLSFLLPDESSVRNVVHSTVCCSTVCCSLNYYSSILSSYINAGISSVLRTSVQPFSSFLRSSVLSPSAATSHSVQPPTFVRFLTFLHWLLSLLYFSQFAVTYFSYFAGTYFFSINSCAFSYCLSFLLPNEASG